MDELTLEEYDTIHALRTIEPVAHEREDWRVAVSAAMAASAFATEPVEPVDVLRVIQLQEEKVTTVSPDAASQMTKGLQGGVVRRPGRPPDSR